MYKDINKLYFMTSLLCLLIISISLVYIVNFGYFESSLMIIVGLIDLKYTFHYWRIHINEASVNVIYSKTSVLLDSIVVSSNIVNVDDCIVNIKYWDSLGREFYTEYLLSTTNGLCKINVESLSSTVYLDNGELTIFIK